MSALVRLFQHLGWEVLAAATVADGLALLDSGIDWAILDLNLPDGDGESVLAAIRQSGFRTRVVVATGTADFEHLDRVRQMKPDFLVQKPIDLDLLLGAFGRVA